MAESPLEKYNRLRRKQGHAPRQAYEPRTGPSYRRQPSVVAARGNRGRRQGSRRSSGGGTSVGLTSSPAVAQSAWTRTLDQLTSDFTQSATRQEVVNRAVEQESEMPERGGLQGIWDDVWDNPVMKGIGSSPVGKVLNLLGRPIQAVSESGQSMAEASRPGQPWWMNPNLYATQGLPGFWRGLMGQGDARGPGDVYEAVKNNPVSFSPRYNPLRGLEEAHPNIEQTLAVSVGLIGEAAADPLNVAMGAVPNVIRNGPVAGRVLTRDTLTETVQAAGRQGVEDVLSANPAVLGNSALTPDEFAARVEAAMDDALNNSVLDIAGGGAPHAKTIGGSAFPSYVSQSWEQTLIDAISSDADTAVQRIINDPQSMTPGNINARRAQSPDFDRFWGELTNTLKAHPKWGPILAASGGSVDEVIAIIKGSSLNPKSFMRTTVNDIWETIRHEHHVALEQHTRAVFEAVENPTRRSLGIRLGRGSGSHVVQIPVVGRAFGYAGDKLGQIPGASGISRAFYESRFPSLFAGKISRARAYGLNGFDKMVDEIRKYAKDFTPDEGRLLFDALEKNLPTLGDARMDGALAWLRKHRDDIFDREVAEGARSVDNAAGQTTSIPQPDYVYIHLKGGTKELRKEFNEGRKANFAKPNSQVPGPGQYNSSWARANGLKPVDDAFQALLMHYMKSSNKITNAFFWQDLAANYGIMNNATTTGIGELERVARHITEVPYSKLSASFKQMVKDTNGKFYIPDEIHRLGQDFDKMMDWGTTANINTTILGRNFSKIINKFKILTTIPYPGFHVRNFMGDTMMGMLDGVKPSRYYEIMTKYAKSRRGLSAQFKIVPGMEYSFKELMQMFRMEANSGYIHADSGLTKSASAGNIAREYGRKAMDKVTDLADDRELLPRFTHYVTAMQDEARALWSQGERNLEVIRQRAQDAALWRVNHYKFDYNALLPWEKTLKATVFPFYTYSRKAIPALMEQMFINPHYFQMTNRFMQNNDGSAADAFNFMNMPQWIRDFGYGSVTDEANPLVLTGEAFPTNVMDVISSNSLKEASLDMLGMANPFIQAPIEQAMGRTLYDNRQIQGGAFDYLMSKVPLIGDLQEQFSNLPGVPGESPYPVTETNDWTKFLSNRLLGGGFPLRRVTEGQQAQQANTNFDEFVEGPINDYNRSQDQFTIVMGEEGIFTINNKYTGEPVGPKFTTPQEAVMWAVSKLPAPEHPDIPLINRRPNVNDLMEMLAAQ